MSILCILAGMVWLFLRVFPQDYARKGQPLPERLVSSKPGDDFTEEKLLMKKAQACHQRNAKEEMLSTLKRLNSRDAEQFLWENKYFGEVADRMVERGNYFPLQIGTIKKN